MKKIYNYNGESIGVVLASPECYGAIGDGENDDTIAFQKALTDNKYIVCNPNSTYYITASLRVKKNTTLDLNGSTIVFAVRHGFFNFLEGDTFGEYNGNGNIIIRNGYIIGGDISFIHGENITIENVHFRNCENDHVIEICACKNFTVRNCSLIGMAFWETSLEYINVDITATYGAFPWNNSGQGTAFYDNTVCENIKIIGNYFAIGDTPYNNGNDAFGVHAKNAPSGVHQDNIVVKDNIIKGFALCGLRVNNMHNVIISNNHIDTQGSCVLIGDRIASDDVLISYNYLNSDTTLIDKVSSSNVTVAYNSVITDNQDI